MTTWKHPAALLTAPLVATVLAVPAAAAPVETTVGTPRDLANALANAKPGATITLTGPRDAVLSNGGGYGLHLLRLSTVDEEAVHFRTSSSDNVIRRSTIRDAGRGKPSCTPTTRSATRARV